MKTSSIVEGLFLATVIVLVVLVLGLDCMQGSAGLRLLGIIRCDYGLTSADLAVKALATTVLVLFLGLIFGPILAVVKEARGIRRSKSRDRS